MVDYVRHTLLKQAPLYYFYIGFKIGKLIELYCTITILKEIRGH